MAFLTNSRNSAPTIFDIFNRPLSDFDFTGRAAKEANFEVDVRDMGNCYLLEADLPGTKKEDISLNFEEGVLTVTASHHAQDAEKSTQEQEGDEQHKAADDSAAGTYLIRERLSGTYERSFRFQDADAEAISATFEDCKLTVVLKKQQLQKGRQITIA